MADTNRCWLLERIMEFSDDTAIVCRDVPHTYSELGKKTSYMLDSVRAVAVPAGSVVAIVSDYTFDSISLFLALLEHSCVIVPMTTKIEAEIAERLEEAYADYRIGLDDEGRPSVTRLESTGNKHALIRQVVDAGSAGLILFSSGSTGKPKAMIHDLDRLLARFVDRKSRKSNMLVFLMFDHIGGLNTLFNALAAGSTLTIPEHREAEYVCALIARGRVEVLPASPTFLNLILISEAHKHHDLSSLKLITYGTEPMTEGLLAAVSNAFPGVKLLQTFGTSETGIAKTTSKSSTSTLMKIDPEDTEYRIVDGELHLRSKTRVLGYLNASMENFSDDGWYSTGDLVEQQDDGFLRIVGRIKELINVGGLKVLPEEVESVLQGIPGVRDSMVSGEKNSITGQIVVADIVLAEGADPAAVRSLIRKTCRGRLESYKVPAKINFVERTNFSDRFKKIRRKEN